MKDLNVYYSTLYFLYLINSRYATLEIVKTITFYYSPFVERSPAFTSTI